MDYTRKLELHYSIESVISLSYSGMKSVYSDLFFKVFVLFLPIGYSLIHKFFLLTFDVLIFYWWSCNPMKLLHLQSLNSKTVCESHYIQHIIVNQNVYVTLLS